MDCGVTDSPREILLTPILERAFPFFLAIGMSYCQFWDDDPRLAVFYKEADDIRFQRKNTEMWLQGSYIYQSLCAVHPIFNPYAKSGTKAYPYVERPYEFGKTEEERKADEARAAAEKFKALADMFNANRKRKQGGD